MTKPSLAMRCLSLVVIYAFASALAHSMYSEGVPPLPRSGLAGWALLPVAQLVYAVVFVCMGYFGRLIFPLKSPRVLDLFVGCAAVLTIAGLIVYSEMPSMSGPLIPNDVAFLAVLTFGAELAASFFALMALGACVRSITDAGTRSDTEKLPNAPKSL